MPFNGKSDNGPLLGQSDVLGANGCHFGGHNHSILASIQQWNFHDDHILHVATLSPMDRGRMGHVILLDNPPLLWIELMMEHETFGATGSGLSNSSNHLVSAANVCCQGEFWGVHPSIWDTSVDISVADTWCFLDFADCTLPVWADTLTFKAPLPSIQHHQRRVQEFFSGEYVGAMANPAQTDDVNAGAVAWILLSTAFVDDSTAWFVLRRLGPCAL